MAGVQCSGSPVLVKRIAQTLSLGTPGTLWYSTVNRLVTSPTTCSSLVLLGSFITEHWEECRRAKQYVNCFGLTYYFARLHPSQKSVLELMTKTDDKKIVSKATNILLILSEYHKVAKPLSCKAGQPSLRVPAISSTERKPCTSSRYTALIHTGTSELYKLGRPRG